jgi:hypothetical protein
MGLLGLSSSERIYSNTRYVGTMWLEVFASEENFLTQERLIKKRVEKVTFQEASAHVIE